MYLLGIDGGETKTHCIIGDEKGNICAEGFGGGANYDLIGIDVVKQSIETAISRALSKLNLQIHDISYAVIGLAGADYEEDFNILEKMGKSIFNEIPFKIVNNCWLGLRAGSEEGWGVVSICDTGHGSMGKSKEGIKIELRNMNYTLGNRGGSGELIKKAVHYAFRAYEGGEISSRLQYELPKLLGLFTMDEVDTLIRKQGCKAEGMNQIPQLVMRLAKEEDVLCQDMMISMGSALGRTAAGIIRRLDVKRESVPVILLGNMFTNDNPLLIDAYKLEVHKIAPRAKFKVLDKRPVLGAYHLALDYINSNKKVSN